MTSAWTIREIRIHHRTAIWLVSIWSGLEHRVFWLRFQEVARSDVGFGLAGRLERYPKLVIRTGP